MEDADASSVRDKGATSTGSEEKLEEQPRVPGTEDSDRTKEDNGNSTVQNDGATSAGAEQKSEPKTTIPRTYDSDISDVEEVTMADVPRYELAIRKSKMRTKQAMRWNADINHRIKWLEETVQHLNGEDMFRSDVDLLGAAAAHRGPNQAPEIKHLTWDEFKPPRAPITISDTHGEKHNLRLDHRPRSVLEVLDREPEQVGRGGQQSHKVGAIVLQSGKEQATINGEGHQHEHAPSSGSASKAPARLRIRSRPLLAQLSDISPDEFIVRPGKMVFMRPFKFFCVYEDEIRARHRHLEEKFAHELDSGEAETSAATQDPMVPEDRNKPRASKTGHEKSGAYQSEKDSPKALEHFRLLIKFMDEDLKPLFDFRTSLGKKEVTTIAFPELWHLFKHNQEVYVPTSDKEKSGIYRVYKFTGGRNDLPSTLGPLSRPTSELLGPGSWKGAFVLQGWSLTFDGDVYRPQLKTFGIRPYEGEKEITSLPIYPLEHDSNHKTIRESYVANAQNFVDFCQKKGLYRRYNGPNLDPGAKGEQINTEVIIDFGEAFTASYERPVAIDFDNDVILNDYREVDEIVPGNTHCKEEGCCTSDVIHCDYDIDNDLRKKHFKNGHDSPILDVKSDIETDEDRILLPSQVYGFVLRKQKWATLSTAQSCLKEVESLNAWEDLVLDPATKTLVEAQVMHHLAKTEEEKNEGKGMSFGEFISGKGRSLVFLLHGPPGVGKTSTAECIADRFKKPLYSLTSGNLGVDPDTVEQKLETHFNLAAKWGCILLLDEADVFLQQRKRQQLNINAIVSVFLRQLEYYNGVLFLTTNRLGDIDRAFKSRIHVALEYKRFNSSTSRKVYALCLKGVKEMYASRGRKLKIKEDDIFDWAKKHFKDNHWNGREIFNSCQTAIALAEWEYKTGVQKKLVLREKHFEKVAEASRGFEKYLSDLREEEVVEAWKQGARIDDNDLRGRTPQGAFMVPAGNSMKRNTRKAEADEDDDDDDESTNGKKDRKRGKKKRDNTDDSTTDSDG